MIAIIFLLVFLIDFVDMSYAHQLFTLALDFFSFSFYPSVLTGTGKIVLSDRKKIPSVLTRLVVRVSAFVSPEFGMIGHVTKMVLFRCCVRTCIRMYSSAQTASIMDIQELQACPSQSWKVCGMTLTIELRLNEPKS